LTLNCLKGAPKPTAISIEDCDARRLSLPNQDFDVCPRPLRIVMDEYSAQFFGTRIKDIME
jgi:hypothetical protein